MTKRKLWSGWNSPKAVGACFIGYIILHIILWAREARIFDYCMVFSRIKSEYGITEECRETWVDLTDLLQEANSVRGMVYALIFSICVSVIVVHKESFRQNWNLTLRRIPKYRGKYLRSKMIAVLFPAVGFSVYYGTQWLYRFDLYQTELQREYDFYVESQMSHKIKYVPLEKEEFFRVIPMKPILEMSLYSVITALLLLLLNLAARRIKKDLAGFCAAIAGLVAVVLLFFEVVPMERAVELVLLFGGIGIIAFFTVRHVYVKL